MLTLAQMFLVILALFCVLIATAHAMIGAKDFAYAWAALAVVMALITIITFAEGAVG